MIALILIVAGLAVWAGFFMDPIFNGGDLLCLIIILLGLALMATSHRKKA